MNYVIELVASFFAVVIVLTLHEFAHAFVAYKCGDLTPKFNKRLTLNPMRHFDLVGLLCFTFVGFGWAKPVPINPNNFKHYRRGLAFTSTAGVIMNYLTAFLSLPFFMLVVNFCPEIPLLTSFLLIFTRSLFSYSLSFCVFNLLPFFPLDGFNFLSALAKPWNGEALE
ncbi:MAG: site-2 protease family protein [Clostridia bacterium]|nr:site-2 protease family protein [Clostridia bacterium]